MVAPEARYPWEGSDRDYEYEEVCCFLVLFCYTATVTSQLKMSMGNLFYVDYVLITWLKSASELILIFIHIRFVHLPFCVFSFVFRRLMILGGIDALGSFICLKILIS